MGKCAQNQGETTTLPCPEQQAGLKPELAVGIHHQPHIQRPCSRFWLTQSAGAPSGEDEKQERSEQPGLCARERAGLGWAAPAQAVLRLHQFRDQLPTQSSPGSSFQHRTALCSLQAGQGFQQCHQSSWVGQKSFSFSVQRCLQHISSVMFNTQPGIHLPSRTGGAAGQRGTALDSSQEQTLAVLLWKTPAAPSYCQVISSQNHSRTGIQVKEGWSSQRGVCCRKPGLVQGQGQGQTQGQSCCSPSMV